MSASDALTPSDCPKRNLTSSPGPAIPATSPSAQCPVPRDRSTLNPRNNMPYLSQLPAPGQVKTLSVAREISSIPRTRAKLSWEYPSPQQFYNALWRKGWSFPEEHVEPMVVIHNRLNEDAWAEILKWESRTNGGAVEAARLELSEFAGIHDKLSHKARLYQLARWFFPSYLRFTPPFDRHDWIVRRPQTNQRVRFIIDYYSLRKGVGGDPEFHLDVRPAMDSLGNIKVRLVAASELLWGPFVARVRFCRSINTCFLLVGVSVILAVLVTLL